MDLKAIEERNQMCLDQAIDEGWDEGDIARILFDEDVPALLARVKALEAALLDIEPRLNDVREFVADFEAIGDTEESCQRIALKDIGWIRQRISGVLSPTESDKPSGRG